MYFQAEMVKAAFEAQRKFLIVVSKCKPPTQQMLESLLKPTSDQISAIQVPDCSSLCWWCFHFKTEGRTWSKLTRTWTKTSLRTYTEIMMQSVVIFISSELKSNNSLNGNYYICDVLQHNRYTLCFKKTGTLFISFIIHSNDDQFTRNFYQM